MGDNDLVRRGDVKAKKVYCDERHEYVVPVAEIDWLIPAVPQEMSAREALLIGRLNTIIDKLQEQADIHNERAKELLTEEDGQVSQYTWAISLRETYRRTIRTLEDLLCEAEKL